MSPTREFYEVHFLGNYSDWAEHMLDLRRAMNLAVSANQLADWALECGPQSETGRFGSGRDKGRKFREWLVEIRCKDFRPLWDLADTHKHMLIKRGAVATTGIGGAFQHDAFDPVAFDTPHLAIILQDGTERRFPGVCRNVASMWKLLLAEWQL